MIRNFDYIRKIICGDALAEIQQFGENSIALIVTSPPYWNLVDYKVEGQYGQGAYDEYLDQMLKIYKESERILEPNGKFALVVPIVPLPKAIDSSTHTRKLLNLPTIYKNSFKKFAFL